MTDTTYSYSNRKYEIVPYDPAWVRQFEELKAKIQTIFHNVQIEHIGSTSVPLMLGKPCIDVLVIVEDLREVETHVTDMEALGFEYAGEFVTEHSLLFRVMKDNTLLANIHFFPVGHPHNKEMLDVRNYLRSHPEEVKAYSALKQELYTKYHNDYASYRKYKDEYVNKLQERATIS
jgi:GrpB-like predicted nucleotidyltransferase (UPF0157 family)